MKKFFKPPVLSTSFSHKGKSAKHRFENILSGYRKKGTSIAVTAFCITAAASALVSCTNKAASSIAIIGGADGPTAVYIAKNNSGNKDNTDSAEKLYNAKIQYLGDASGVGKIISLLPFGENITHSGTEMNTSQEPFGITMYYIDENNSASENEFENNAAIMFALIENCSNITFKNKESGRSMTFTREEEDKRFDMTLSQFSENLDNFRQLMVILYNNNSNNLDITDDDLVSKAILQNNGFSYLPGECSAEGHIILGTDNTDGNKVIYALATYGEYGFENSKFVKISGSGVIPIRMTFDSRNNLIEYKEPMDGAYHADSIKEIFPKEYYNRIMSSDNYENDYNICKLQEHEYARAYLQSINHAECEISDKSDFTTNYVMPEMDADASNELFEIYYEYPYWIGTLETIEDGIRYVYETEWKESGGGNGVITFRKYRYISKETAEEFVVEVQGKNIKLLSAMNTPKLDRLGNEHYIDSPN